MVGRDAVEPKRPDPNRRLDSVSPYQRRNPRHPRNPRLPISLGTRSILRAIGNRTAVC